MLRYVAISMGEASGSCVEIIIKAVHSRPFGGFGGIIVTGDLGVFKKVSKDLMMPLPFSVFVDNHSQLAEAESNGEQYIFYNTSNIDMDKFAYGEISRETGIGSYMALKVAVDIICNRLAYTLVTTAISADALKLGGYKERGLTELLGVFASSARLENMLVAGKANIFLLSHRRSVKSAIENVSMEKILDLLVKIEGLFVSDYFNDMLPIAVGALNPERCDGNWCGDEEERFIKPAIDVARKIGMKVEGPIVADKLYKNAFEGKYSAVLGMLRGEAYAAAAYTDAVVITWGLPFMRVGSTEDVGLEKAGKNIADITKMKKALEIAVQISDKGVLA